MSAYLMSAADLAAIARTAAPKSSGLDAEAIFNVLLDENMKSIAARYPNASRISDWYEEGEAAFVWEAIEETTHTASEVAELVRCYQYQSCEHDGWDTSRAKYLTDAMLRILAPFVAAEQNAEATKRAEQSRALSALPSLGPKETAREIRKVLKANFPATKFSVVTERGSMVSSVRINWTDGPTAARVDDLVQVFKAGRFDGMTDSYDYDNTRVLSIEGTNYRPACRYIFTSRTVSPTLANRCIALLVAYWGGVESIPTAVRSPYGEGYTIPEGQGNKAPRADLPMCYDWFSLIHQAAEDRTRFHMETSGR